MAGEEEDDGDDGDKKAKPQSELFQVKLGFPRVPKQNIWRHQVDIIFHINWGRFLKGSCRGWGTPTEKIFVETKRDNFFPFHTRRFETSASYQWADKFSEPGDVPDSRNPRFKIQFLSATATTLKFEILWHPCVWSKLISSRRNASYRMI